MLRAKFKCTSVTIFEGGIEEIVLTASYGPGNEMWSKASPTGMLKFSITNPSAVGKFVPGKYYYLDFTPNIAEVTEPT